MITIRYNNINAYVEGSGSPESDYDRQQALLLADGMELAASRNEPLVFH